MSLTSPSPTPSYPSTFSSPTSPSIRHHNRLPSRSERHDHTLKAARLLYEKDHTTIDKSEFRAKMWDLVGVVDGMISQLASYDDLAASLKISQSNLALAERHSEFLEETLKRRETTTPSPAGDQVRYSSPEGSWAKLENLVGLGLEETAPAVGGVKGFFSRSGSTKKRGEQTLRKQPSQRRLGIESLPSLSFSPSPPLPSSTTSLLLLEISELRLQISSLTSLTTKQADQIHTLEVKNGGLEKTKGELMSELEVLTESLFEEANEMVRVERRGRARAEEELRRGREEVDRLREKVGRCACGGSVGMGKGANENGSESSTSNSSTSSFSSSTTSSTTSESLNPPHQHPPTSTSSSTITPHTNFSFPSSSSPTSPSFPPLPPSSNSSPTSPTFPSFSTNPSFSPPPPPPESNLTNNTQKWYSFRSLNSSKTSLALPSSEETPPPLPLPPSVPPSQSLENLENLLRLLSKDGLFEDDVEETGGRSVVVGGLWESSS